MYNNNVYIIHIYSTNNIKSAVPKVWHACKIWPALTFLLILLTSIFDKV